MVYMGGRAIKDQNFNMLVKFKYQFKIECSKTFYVIAVVTTKEYLQNLHKMKWSRNQNIALQNIKKTPKKDRKRGKETKKTAGYSEKN